MYEFTIYDNNTGWITQIGSVSDDHKSYYDDMYKHKIDGIYSADDYYIKDNIPTIRPILDDFAIIYNDTKIEDISSVVIIKRNEYIKAINLPKNADILVIPPKEFEYSPQRCVINDDVFEFGSKICGEFRIIISIFPYKNINVHILVR